MVSPCHGGWKTVNTWRIGIIGVGYMIATKDWHHLTWCLWSSTIIDQQDSMHMQMTYETCAVWIYEYSMDWIQGKFTGKPHIYWENLWFPVNFPLNQSIEICRYCMCAEVLLVYMAAMVRRPFRTGQRRWFLKASTGRSWWTHWRRTWAAGCGWSSWPSQATNSNVGTNNGNIWKYKIYKQSEWDIHPHISISPPYTTFLIHDILWRLYMGIIWICGEVPQDIGI